MSEPSSVRGLRVLMTTDAVGGVFSYALNLTRELCRRGAQVLLLCMGPEPKADQRAEVEAVPGLQLEHAPYSLEWMDEPWESVDQAGQWLLERGREFGADVVHLNGYCHAALPWDAPTIVVAHSCISTWWRAVFRQDAPDRYGAYRDRVKLGLRQAGAVVAPSASLLKGIREAYGYAGKASVIFNGISSAEYFRQPKEPIFLAAGRLWDRAKNMDLIVKAAPQLPWPVHMVGEGFAGPGNNGVKNVGRLSRSGLARLMGTASVLLHPAR